MKRKYIYIWILLLCCFLFLFHGDTEQGKEQRDDTEYRNEDCADILSAIPEFSEEAYIVLNHNIPYFTPEEKECRSAFEIYSDLDELGRCGMAYANIGIEIMPTEERGAIGHVKPSGWQFAKYDIVDGTYLYNRCHLIGYQLAGENANEKNLITGTRFCNVSGMLPFENMVYEYVKETQNHVLYRVTPLYKENDLVATGIQMEAYSVEDYGAGICFHVFIYNSQPGIVIDYATGESRLIQGDRETIEENEIDHTDINANHNTYILNTNTGKFHLPTCESVKEMKEKNKKEVSMGREEIINSGYSPCQRCNP